MPDVSLVMPTYNRERLLPQALESAIASEVAEILVVNDGSTDGTAGYLDEIARRHPVRVVVIHQANGGQARAINAGVAAARHELVAYMSDDDELLPSGLDRLAAAVDARPEVVLAGGCFEMMDAEGRTYDRFVVPETWTLEDMLRSGVCPFGPGTLWRRSAFLAAGGWDPAFRFAPDVEFYFRLGLHGTFLTFPETVSRYRIYAGSTTTAGQSAEGAAEIVRIASSYFAREDLPPDVRALERTTLRLAYIAAGRRIGLGDDTSADRFKVVDTRPLVAGASELARRRHEQEVAATQERRRASRASGPDDLVRRLRHELAERDATVRRLRVQLSRRTGE